MITIMLKWVPLRLLLQFISLILFVYQKHTYDDSNSEISGYTLARSDHTSNNKSGDACIYYESFLPIRIFNAQYLQESICFELKKLVTKHVTFYLSTDTQAKVKMILKRSLKTLN